MTGQLDLFGEVAPPLLPGFTYQPDFIDAAQEAELLEVILGLELHEARYKAWTALRRIASFGSEYDFDTNLLRSGPALPAALAPLRNQVAARLAVEPESFINILVTEYQPGTPLGWHRDVPDFEDIVGVSLAAPCEMRLRPYDPDATGRRRLLKLTLEPRSAYILRGEARWGWQHSIMPTPALRYSVTFRTPSRRR